jgi:thiosulfate reductase cytochrome b subunit
MSTEQDNVETVALTQASNKSTPMADEQDETSETYRDVLRLANRTPTTAKAHLFVAICHWSMVLLIVLSILSGMRIGWAYIESPLGGETGIWSNFIGSIAPKGTLFGINLIELHVSLVFFMLAVAILYVVYLSRSRTVARLRVTTRDIEKLKESFREKNFLTNKPALWSANLLVYWMAFFFLLVLLITGTMMYWPDWSPISWAPVEWIGGYATIRLVHGLVAYLFIPYAILHSVLQWFFGRFWSIFKVRVYLPHIRAGFVGMVFALTCFGWLYAWNDVPRQLTIAPIPESVKAPVLDGDASDPVWSYATAQTIRGTKGLHQDDGYVDVTIKGVHDGKYVYFMFQWKDPDVSLKRFPLKKTIDGWEVLQTAFDKFDENVYYEDKLAVYITDLPNGGCAGTCHAGSGPSAARGDKHGMHYTTHGEIGDVWHWKSVRTNNMAGENEPGYADDMHFGPLTPVPPNLKPGQRYTGGYDTDPHPAGSGYRYNFVKVASQDPASTNVQPTKLPSFAGSHYNGNQQFNKNLVRPIKLPLTHDIRTNSDPTTSEEGAIWWIRESEGIPYDEKLDNYPVGALIPNILLAPFKGDQADVRAKGKWHNGYWTLETRRVLDTGSKYDVAFKFERPVYLSVATFNRTQTRHSEHIEPLKVILQNSPTKSVGTN